MSTERLLQNVMDVVQEGQLKLGYRPETIRLYYPLASLCAFLGEKMDAAHMEQALNTFAQVQADTLGAVEISRKGERFCIAVPPQGAAYVHAHTPEDGFLAGFIRLIERHGTTIEALQAHFARYSEHVHVEALHNGEFDFLLYFEDGVPDDFRYCIAVEPCHLTYHRFTPADYEAFGF